MRKLLKSESGELMMFSDRETVTPVFCPVTASTDDRCLDSCAWYREEVWESSDEVSCYCKRHEIGLRHIKTQKGAAETEQVIALAEGWVRQLSAYYDEHMEHALCAEEAIGDIGAYIRKRLNP
jgi:hypothetical protein